MSTNGKNNLRSIKQLSCPICPQVNKHLDKGNKLKIKTSIIALEQGKYPNTKTVYRIHRDMQTVSFWYSKKWGWTKTTSKPLKRVTTFKTKKQAEKTLLDIVFMKTHTGEEIKGERLQAARNHVANEKIATAHAIYKEDPYAAHVTPEQKIEFLNKDLKSAEEMRTGQHDNTFWMWQRMNTFITGECIALLK